MTSDFRSFLRKHYFEIDERSLGLFRIVIALTLIEDWIHRWIDRAVFLAPDGVLPASMGSGFSVFKWVSSGFQLDALMITGLAIYLLFALGYRTRLTHILAFAFQVMMCHRNEWINNAGDVIASSLLFWTWFLPTGARFSLDAWTGRATRFARSAWSVRWSLAPLAIYLQIAVIYFASALSKTGQAWTDGTALYYFWNLTFGSNLGVLLSRTLPLFVIELLSTGALICEFLCPILSLAPLRRWPLRRIAVILLVGMHLGIDLTFFTGVFQYFAISGLILLVSSKDWDLLGHSWARPSLLAGSSLDEPRTRPSRRLTLSVKAATELCVAFFMAVCGYQAVCESLNYRYGAGTAPDAPDWCDTVLAELQLKQVWRMYAPQPGPAVRWWVLQGTFADGSKRDLLWDRPVDFNRPLDVGGRQSRFWTRYVFVLPYVQNLIDPFLDYVEHEHRVDGLRKIDLFFVEQATPPPGTDISNQPRIFDLASRDLSTHQSLRMAVDHRVDWKWEEVR